MSFEDEKKAFRDLLLEVYDRLVQRERRETFRVIRGGLSDEPPAPDAAPPAPAEADEDE